MNASRNKTKELKKKTEGTKKGKHFYFIFGGAFVVERETNNEQRKILKIKLNETTAKQFRCHVFHGALVASDGTHTLHFPSCFRSMENSGFFRDERARQIQNDSTKNSVIQMRFRPTVNSVHENRIFDRSNYDVIIKNYQFVRARFVFDGCFSLSLTLHFSFNWSRSNEERLKMK